MLRLKIKLKVQKIAHCINFNKSKGKIYQILSCASMGLDMVLKND